MGYGFRGSTTFCGTSVATVRLREAPAGLAVRRALAEPERGQGSHPIEEDLAASDGVTEPEPGALGCSEVSPVFRLVDVGDAGELGRVGDLGGVTLDHDVETVETVATGGQDTASVPGEVLRLALAR